MLRRLKHGADEKEDDQHQRKESRPISVEQHWHEKRRRATIVYPAPRGAGRKRIMMNSYQRVDIKRLRKKKMCKRIGKNKN